MGSCSRRLDVSKCFTSCWSHRSCFHVRSFFEWLYLPQVVPLRPGRALLLCGSSQGCCALTDGSLRSLSVLADALYDCRLICRRHQN